MLSKHHSLIPISVITRLALATRPRPELPNWYLWDIYSLWFGR